MRPVSQDPARLRWLVAVMAAGGLVAGYWYFDGARSRHDEALENLRECQRLAEQIAAAQRAPRRAGLETRSLEDLGSLVESVAKQAGFTADRVLRIDPRGARRLGKTPYMEQATEVELHEVSLEQLVKFVTGLTTKDDQLQINTLRLRVPHEAGAKGGGEPWLAEVVLTQRIYAPTTARP